MPVWSGWDALLWLHNQEQNEDTPPCPTLLSVAEINYDEKQLGKKRAYVTYTSWSQSTTKGSQGRNSSRNRGRKHRRILFTGWFSMTCSILFIQPRTTLPWDDTTYSALGPPTSIIIKKMPHRLAYRPVLQRYFFNWDFLFLDDSPFIILLPCFRIIEKGCWVA